MVSKISDLSNSFFNEALLIRRELHMHPELSFQEFNTSDFLAKKLDEFGVPYNQGYVKTGIVAKIEGRNPNKKVIALRADMDALPVEEKNNLYLLNKEEKV